VSVVDALRSPHPCPCDCHHTLSLEDRVISARAMLRFDDAIRGLGYEPIYDLAADGLYRAAQQIADPDYRFVAVRDGPCIHRRLVGFAVHEIIHALEGDTSRANYGIPWGAPYGVPVDVPVGEEAAFLAPHNRAEARAFVGVAPLADALFGISWPVYTARDVGTYGFPGGNAVVAVPRGFRSVAHFDPVHHRDRYRRLARALEDEARADLTDAKIADYKARFEAAEAIGKARRKVEFPSPASLARIAPRQPDRNALCSCGSGKKFKKCCGAVAS
jgi:hypothetical protein